MFYVPSVGYDRDVDDVIRRFEVLFEVVVEEPTAAACGKLASG